MTHANLTKISHVIFGIGILLVIVLCSVVFVYFKSRADGGVSASVSIYEDPPVIDSVYVTDVSSSSMSNVSTIYPSAGTTKSIYINGVISDTSGDASVRRVAGFIMRSGTSGCPGDTLSASDNNNCYILSSCSLDSSNGDNQRTYSCNIPVQYYADATTSGDYASENWQVVIGVWNDVMSDSVMPIINVFDADGGNDPTFEMGQTLSMHFSPDTIDFGTMAAGTQTTSGQAQAITATQDGNTVADFQLVGPGTGAGDPMVCTTGGVDNGTSIPQSNQQFNGSAVAFDDSGNVTLSTTPFVAPVGLSLQSNDIYSDDNGDNTTAPSFTFYAMLKLPADVHGSCSGTVDLTAYPHL